MAAKVSTLLVALACVAACITGAFAVGTDFVYCGEQRATSPSVGALLASVVTDTGVSTLFSGDGDTKLYVNNVLEVSSAKVILAADICEVGTDIMIVYTEFDVIPRRFRIFYKRVGVDPPDIFNEIDISTTDFDTPFIKCGEFLTSNGDPDVLFMYRRSMTEDYRLSYVSPSNDLVIIDNIQQETPMGFGERSFDYRAVGSDIYFAHFRYGTSGGGSQLRIWKTTVSALIATQSFQTKRNIPFSDFTNSDFLPTELAESTLHPFFIKTPGDPSIGILLGCSRCGGGGATYTTAGPSTQTVPEQMGGDGGYVIINLGEDPTGDTLEVTYHASPAPSGAFITAIYEKYENSRGIISLVVDTNAEPIIPTLYIETLGVSCCPDGFGADENGNCAPCPLGHAFANNSICVPLTNCPEGYVESIPPTRSTDRQCRLYEEGDPIRSCYDVAQTAEGTLIDGIYTINPAWALEVDVYCKFAGDRAHSSQSIFQMEDSPGILTASLTEPSTVPVCDDRQGFAFNFGSGTEDDTLGLFADLKGRALTSGSVAGQYLSYDYLGYSSAPSSLPGYQSTFTLAHRPLSFPAVGITAWLDTAGGIVSWLNGTLSNSVNVTQICQCCTSYVEADSPVFLFALDGISDVYVDNLDAECDPATLHFDWYSNTITAIQPTRLVLPTGAGFVSGPSSDELGEYIWTVNGAPFYRDPSTASKTAFSLGTSLIDPSPDRNVEVSLALEISSLEMSTSASGIDFFYFVDASGYVHFGDRGTGNYFDCDEVTSIGTARSSIELTDLSLISCPSCGAQRCIGGVAPLTGSSCSCAQTGCQSCFFSLGEYALSSFAEETGFLQVAPFELFQDDLIDTLMFSNESSRITGCKDACEQSSCGAVAFSTLGNTFVCDIYSQIVLSEAAIAPALRDAGYYINPNTCLTCSSGYVQYDFTCLSETQPPSVSVDDVVFTHQQVVAPTSLFPLDVSVNGELTFDVAFVSSPSYSGLEYAFGLVMATSDITFDLATSTLLNITVSDSRDVCVANGKVEEGPCTTTATVEIRHLSIAECAADAFVTLASDSYTYEFTPGTPVLTASPATTSKGMSSTLPTGTYTVSTDDQQFFSPGTYSVTYDFITSSASGFGTTCVQEVAVYAGTTFEVSEIPYTASNYTGLSVLIGSLFRVRGEEFNNVIPSFLIEPDIEVPIAISIDAPSGRPFVFATPSDDYQVQLVADIRLCPDGTEFPELPVYVRGRQLQMNISLITETRVIDLEPMLGAVTVAEGCWSVGGSAEITTFEGFLSFRILIQQMITTPARRRREQTPVLYNSADGTIVAAKLTGTAGAPLGPEAANFAPLAATDEIPPYFLNCPTEPISYDVAADAVVETVELVTLSYADNVAIVSVSGPASGTRDLNVYDSPHTIQVTIADAFQSVDCIYQIVLVPPTSSASTSLTFSEIVRSGEENSLFSTFLYTYNLLETNWDADPFTNIDLSALSSLEIVITENQTRTITVRDVARASDVFFTVDLTLSSTTPFPEEYTITSEKTQVKLRYVDQNDNEVEVSFSSEDCEIFVGPSGGHISIAAQFPVTSSFSYTETTLVIQYAVVGSFPSVNSTWEIDSSPFFGYEFAYDLQDSGIEELRNAVVRNDFDDPVFDMCPSDITREITTEAVGDIVWRIPVATDNVDTSVDVELSLYTPLEGSVQSNGTHASYSFRVGIYILTYTATDDFGNEATCTFTITVRDVTDPVATCYTNTVEATGPTTDITNFFWLSDATDNTETSLRYIDLRSLPLGSYTQMVVYTDESLNEGSCTAVIDIVDTADPVMNCAATTVADTGLVGVTNPQGPIARLGSSYTQVEIDWEAEDTVGLSRVVLQGPDLQYQVLKDYIAEESDIVTSDEGDSDSTYYPVGDTPITLILYDYANNTAQCNMVVTVPELIAAGSQQAATGLSTTVIGVIGGLGGVVLILLIVFFLIYRNRRRRPQNWEDIFLEMEKFRESEDGSGARRPREIKRGHLKQIADLGKGAFGIVYKGRLTEHAGIPGYLVAVKSLHETASGQDRLELLEEAAVMAQFEHENVVSLIGAVTAGDPLLVVLEYMEHGALKSYLERYDNIPAAKLLQFVHDCALGLAHIHEKGFIHRDVAARNALLSSELIAKIADFGLTRESSEHEDYYRSRGGALPVRWTAPEALESRKFDESTDIWSFGILIHEIYTQGQTPYHGYTNQKVWVEVSAGYRLPQPATCPDDVYKVMKTCWDEDAKKRPSFNEIATTIGKLRGSAPTTAPRKLSGSGNLEPRRINSKALKTPNDYVDTSTASEITSAVISETRLGQPNAASDNYVDTLTASEVVLPPSTIDNYVDTLTASEVPNDSHGSGKANSEESSDNYVDTMSATEVPTIVAPPRKVNDGLLATSEPNVSGLRWSSERITTNPAYSSNQNAAKDYMTVFSSSPSKKGAHGNTADEGNYVEPTPVAPRRTSLAPNSKATNPAPKSDAGDDDRVYLDPAIRIAPTPPSK